jgi:hypothetical protein
MGAIQAIEKVAVLVSGEELLGGENENAAPRQVKPPRQGIHLGQKRLVERDGDLNGATGITSCHTKSMASEVAVFNSGFNAPWCRVHPSPRVGRSRATACGGWSGGWGNLRGGPPRNDC